MAAIFWNVFFWRLPLPIGPLILACLAWWAFSQIEQGRAINYAVTSAVKDLVAGAEVKALESQIAERDRQLKAGQIVIDAYQAQLRNAVAADAVKAERIEQEITDYEAKLSAAGRACALGPDDREFLLKP
ncbi:hypothetical protein C5748_17160 [Phyllobacterium phragmitis]|uniref:Uncharacterized protein n=1 Tax=Phyllobacterium phragmitis TaxID=2670329 RepID=A0A2S9INT5_9HYPH|nr:hypothetical protein [Phyllobacterium phragmitis]PRD42194.1 hypothetical protein C5748_17160 [Phyllobacterium phragmitis]